MSNKDFYKALDSINEKIGDNKFIGWAKVALDFISLKKIKIHEMVCDIPEKLIEISIHNTKPNTTSHFVFTDNQIVVADRQDIYFSTNKNVPLTIKGLRDEIYSKAQI